MFEFIMQISRDLTEESTGKLSVVRSYKSIKLK